MKRAFCSLVLFLKGHSEAILGVWADLNAGEGGGVGESQNPWQLRPGALSSQSSPCAGLVEAYSPGKYQPRTLGSKRSTSVVTSSFCRNRHLWDDALRQATSGICGFSHSKNR